MCNYVSGILVTVKRSISKQTGNYCIDLSGDFPFWAKLQIEFAWSEPAKFPFLVLCYSFFFSNFWEVRFMWVDSFFSPSLLLFSISCVFFTNGSSPAPTANFLQEHPFCYPI